MNNATLVFSMKFKPLKPAFSLKQFFIFLSLFSLNMFLASPELRAETEMTMCGTAWPPFVMEDKGKLPGGISIELLDDVFAELGIQSQNIAIPWARCLQGILIGEFDGGFDTIQRKGYAVTRVPHVIVPIGLLVHQKSLFETFSKDILDEGVFGGVRGYATSDYLKAKTPSFILANNDEHLFLMIG